MLTPVRVRLKPYIQPFERQLAFKELASLTGAVTVKQSTTDPYEFGISTDCTAAALADRLAYWECTDDGERHLTAQVVRETTSLAVRNGVPLESIPSAITSALNASLPQRRSLRYLVHGIHEYRGKFFPQLVRAALNIANVPPGGTVLDPMCGSGTTLVEALLLGCNAFGADMNPLSVFVSEAKCRLLRASPDDLTEGYELLRDRLTAPRAADGLAYLGHLPSADVEYLRRWFAEGVLADLDRLAGTIRGLPLPSTRTLAAVSLSNILRRVSLQEPADLRVRKRSSEELDVDVRAEFLADFSRSLRLVLAGLVTINPAKLGTHAVWEGDARDTQIGRNGSAIQADAIITSPPYATALPYLDTDRLSLCFLGLLTRGHHRFRDQEMIGNREVSRGSRQLYWNRFLSNADSLPDTTVAMIRRIESLNAASEVGFRRKNLAALLAKYFLDMRDVFLSMKSQLRRGGQAFVVIGDNHTIAGGKRVAIETTNHLRSLATSCGFVHEETIPMEMLVSRDIFRRNAVASEAILVLRHDRS